MSTYISIFRGINVSGHKTVKMDALRKMFAELGFLHIRTYVQSGNVIFNAPETASGKLEQKIAGKFSREFGFEVPVIVLPVEKLDRIIRRNPFAADPGKEPRFMHVTFLSAPPVEPDCPFIEERKSPGEEILFTDEAVYLYCPNGYGTSRLSNTLMETKLRVAATTRNWKTTNQLLEIARNGMV